MLIWLEFQDCAGNSESMLRSGSPTVTDFVLDLLSWEYHELIMAGAGKQAGKQAEDALERVVREHPGEDIAVVEGAIPTADGGVYCTIGGRTALDIAQHVCTSTAACIAVGACAWDGGLVRSNPNPTGALGLQEAVPGLKTLVNLGGCPHNPANTAAVLTHYLTFHEMPALDSSNRPHFAYGNLIHDQCERRAYYDAFASVSPQRSRLCRFCTASLSLRISASHPVKFRSVVFTRFILVLPAAKNAKPILRASPLRSNPVLVHVLDHFDV